jgi:hypothetical protein
MLSVSSLTIAFPLRWPIWGASRRLANAEGRSLGLGLIADRNLPIRTWTLYGAYENSFFSL